PSRRETNRTSGSIANQICDGSQRQTAKGPRSHGARIDSRTGRRGDRMIGNLKRRDFLTLLGGTAAVWPLSARGQQPTLPVVAFVNSGGSTQAGRADAFRKGLNEAGFMMARP